MLLPSRLRQTTLGDLLGTLSRASATGTLELVEDLGRTHRIHLQNGRVVAVEYDGAAQTLAEVLRAAGELDDATLRHSLLRALSGQRLHGEVLVKDFRVAPPVVAEAVRFQLKGRLTRLEQLTDAQVRFRVTVRPPRGAILEEPMPPADFLAGRRRFRERVQHAPPRATRAPGPIRRPAEDPSSAWRVLGVPPGTEASEIRRAYRRLARAYHPDLHPDATEPERATLTARFRALTEAYKTLVA